MCAFVYGLNDSDERVRAQSAVEIARQTKKHPCCCNCKITAALTCALADCDRNVRRKAECALCVCGYDVKDCPVSCGSCGSCNACGKGAGPAPVPAHSEPAPAPAPVEGGETAPPPAPAPAPAAAPAAAPAQAEPEAYFPSRLKSTQVRPARRSSLSNLFGLRG